MNSTASLQLFLDHFIPKIQQKTAQLNRATWILETTGNADAAALRASLDAELRLLFHDKKAYEQLVEWDKDPHITDPILKRQMNVLIRTFKPNMVPKNLLETIAQEEASLSLLYSNFRPTLDGNRLSENDIRAILTNETDVTTRKKAWNASKQIGKEMAPRILSLVRLRNRAAQSLGYTDYFSMQLQLQEVDEPWLFALLDNVAIQSEGAYEQLIAHISATAAARFAVSIEEIGPWAWSDPFCQENPLNVQELDRLAEGIDLIETARAFYRSMNLSVDGVLQRSDNFERPGKNQHAFCINMDRESDVRTLNNLQPTLKWLETLFHELGHAMYELGYSKQLPWLLRFPPHMLTTEAMALLVGRQPYRAAALAQLLPHSPPELRQKAEESLRRRQLIFSRWVLVMTYFERELYRNPDQDLQALWWTLVGRYQRIHSPGSQSGCDWAAKYHIGLAPVYYYSYLLGELFASTLEVSIGNLLTKRAGEMLTEKMFAPGDRFHWNSLIAHVTGKELSEKDWLTQFA